LVFFHYPRDLTEVEEAEAGVSFPVLIHLTKFGQIRTLILDEPNAARMNAKFKHVCVKKVLYGRPDNPDRIVLVVDHTFTTLITVIRCERNPSSWKIPASWQNALEITQMQTSMDKGVVYVPTVFARKLSASTRAKVADETQTVIQIERASTDLSKISVSSLASTLPANSLQQPQSNGLVLPVISVNEALDQIKDITEFTDYEKKSVVISEESLKQKSEESEWTKVESRKNRDIRIQKEAASVKAREKKIQSDKIRKSKNGKGKSKERIDSI